MDYDDLEAEHHDGAAALATAWGEEWDFTLEQQRALAMDVRRYARAVAEAVLNAAADMADHVSAYGDEEVRKVDIDAIIAAVIAPEGE